VRQIAMFGQRLIDAGLIGAKRAAALQHQSQLGAMRRQSPALWPPVVGAPAGMARRDRGRGGLPAPCSRSPHLARLGARLEARLEARLGARVRGRVRGWLSLGRPRRQSDNTARHLNALPLPSPLSGAAKLPMQTWADRPRAYPGRPPKARDRGRPERRYGRQGAPIAGLPRRGARGYTRGFEPQPQGPAADPACARKQQTANSALPR
jgi:hypothetical protein